MKRKFRIIFFNPERLLNNPSFKDWIRSPLDVELPVFGRNYAIVERYSEKWCIENNIPYIRPNKTGGIKHVL